MKKLLFVFAFVAVYGVSMAMTGTTVLTIDNVQQTIVADLNNDVILAPEGEKKEEKKAAKAEAKTETKSKADAKAKSEGCAGEAKKDCASSCEGKKK